MSFSISSFSISAERSLNKLSIGMLALDRVKAKALIDTTKEIITQYMVNDNLTFTVKTQTKDTEEDKTYEFILKDDLGICPDFFYDYYTYRFTPRTSVTVLQRGDAIRVIKAKTSDTDTTWFAYNAVVLTANVKEISFYMVPSRGPMHRYITSRQAYENKVVFYKYKEPDTNGYVDNHDDLDDEPIV
jgi:hypothetical protein